MKKSTLILIAIIYVASIVLISVFGLKAIVYNAYVTVTKIECTNETDQYSKVYIDEEGRKVIEVEYVGPGNIEDMTGTMLFLTWQVYPDNATSKAVNFVYNEELENCTFIKNELGSYTGQIIFTGWCLIELTMVSTDGTGTSTDVIIWVHNN